MLTECSINTLQGVKVAGIAWGSAHFFQKNGTNTPYDQSPELCIEIISPSNSKQEMKEKTSLYLAKGAQEVWLCDEHGSLQFFGYRGRLKKSRLFPNMLNQVEI